MKPSVSPSAFAFLVCVAAVVMAVPAAANTDRVLYFASGKTILKSMMNGSCLSVFEQDAGAPTGLVAGVRRLYWFDANEKAIMSKRLDESGPKKLIYNNSEAADVKYLAVDDRSEDGDVDLYWTDYIQDKIVMASVNVDGTYNASRTALTTLAFNDTVVFHNVSSSYTLDAPYGVAVNKPKNQLFWTQEQGQFDVLSSSLSGGLVTPHIGYNGIARGIAVDEVTQFIYYVDDSGHKIQETQTNGTSSWKFMSWDPELGEVNYLDVDFNTHYVYWSATDQKKIYYADAKVPNDFNFWREVNVFNTSCDPVSPEGLAIAPQVIPFNESQCMCVADDSSNNGNNNGEGGWNNEGEGGYNNNTNNNDRGPFVMCSDGAGGCAVEIFVFIVLPLGVVSTVVGISVYCKKRYRIRKITKEEKEMGVYNRAKVSNNAHEEATLFVGNHDD